MWYGQNGGTELGGALAAQRQRETLNVGDSGGAGRGERAAAATPVIKPRGG